MGNSLAATTALLDRGNLVVATSALGGSATISGAANAVASETVQAGGSWTGMASIAVGGASDGSLLIDALGTVGAATIDAGVSAGAVGTIGVTGTGAALSASGSMTVGDAGLATMGISAGGGATAGSLTIANAASSSGSEVDVSGAGSGLAVAGGLTVGANGSGALQISNGATVTASSLDAAVSAAAVANISVSGAGSNLTMSGAATVADDGSGVLSVLSGATFAAASLTIGSLGDSSGAVVVSGAGSLVNLLGALNVGTPQGVGDLTIGTGATVDAGVVNLNGDVVLEGGELDPSVTLINQGSTLNGSGTVGNTYIVVEGLLLASGTKPSQRLLSITGTVVGGGALTINGTAQASGSPGVIQINAQDTVDLKSPVLNAATTTFTDNLTPTGTYAVNNSVIDVVFADGTGVLLLDDIADFGGTIATFHSGDAFVIGGGTLSNLGVSNGSTLTFSDSGTNAAKGGVDSIIFGSGVSASRFAIVNGNTVQAVACFAAGTRIETPDGPVAVEDLAEGDRVVTADGRIAPIVWAGSRTIDCRCHPDPETVWPVRVSAGAFGRNVPVRDLYLSPDHAVFADEMLVPARLLVNGKSIVQVRRPKITYLHIELPRHEVILAEGLPVESYLDVGSRMDLVTADVVRLFPEFEPGRSEAARIWETRGVARLVMAGHDLSRARSALPNYQARLRLNGGGGSDSGQVFS